MKLVFVIQRYGLEVAGGAERAAREIAEQVAARGHAVEVVTSCAVNYVDWANHYEPGASDVNGVTVHRFPVPHPRDDRVFGPLNARVVHGEPPLPLYLQEAWMRTQGPYVPELPAWLAEHADRFDAAVFFTYLYWPVYAGLPAVAGRIPTVLMPFAHDEPYLKMPLFDTVFRLANALGFLTEEEQALVQRRFRVDRPTAVTGLGIAQDPAVADVGEMRARYGLGDRPYLLALGRVDPSKGLDELFDFFTGYKARNPSDLALLVMGEPVRPLPDHPDVVPTGYVDEDVKQAALSGCLALAHPSYYESFSIVLAEAWAQRRPGLVQGNCAVLEGQARRSGGAIPYYDFAGFEAAVDLLLADPELADQLGRAGRRYVETRYRWDVVVDRIERLLHTLVPTPLVLRP